MTDPPCNTYTESEDCNAWYTEPNTCYTGNKSRSCTYSTIDGRRDTYCIRNNITEFATDAAACNTAAGYACYSGQCLLDCTETRVCGSCDANPNTCYTNNGTRGCVWTTRPGETNCNQVPDNPQAAPCTIDKCVSPNTCVNPGPGATCQ